MLGSCNTGSNWNVEEESASACECFQSRFSTSTQYEWVYQFKSQTRRQLNRTPVFLITGPHFKVLETKTCLTANVLSIHFK